MNKGIEMTEKEIVIEKGIVKVTLGKKIRFNETEIEKVELDFGSLTGADLCEAETNFRDRFFQPIPDANYSQAFQAAVAAKASKLPYDLILELNFKDFAKVTGIAKGFLQG